MTTQKEQAECRIRTGANPMTNEPDQMRADFGECELYAEEIEVMDCGKPFYAGETTLDDYGDFPPVTAAPEPDAAGGV